MTVRAASNILLAIAAIIVLGLAVLFALMAVGNEAAIWLGGWGLLFLGVPLLIVWLTCLLVGLSLRAKAQPVLSIELSEKKPTKFSLEWLALGIGVLLLGYLALEVATSYYFAQKQIHGMRVNLGLHSDVPAVRYFWLALIDLKLPLGLGALAFGLVGLRNRTKTQAQTS